MESNNPIEVMYKEHEIISEAEDVLEVVNGLWEQDPEKYTKTVKKLVRFFREYADGVHHRKEEEVLFPALENCNDFTLDELLDELKVHHQDFRDYACEVEEALNNKNYPKAQNILQQYMNDLLDHIGAENDELFVLAENLLSEDELETLYFKFKDIDMEVGVEVIEKLKRDVMEA